MQAIHAISVEPVLDTESLFFIYIKIMAKKNLIERTSFISVILRCNMHFILVNGAEQTEIDSSEPAVVRMTNASHVS